MVMYPTLLRQQQYIHAVHISAVAATADLRFCRMLQESLAAAGITPGGSAPAAHFISAIKQGCGVSPQLACHYGSSDAEEV